MVSLKVNLLNAKLRFQNLTTIESMDPTFRDHARYDLGPRRNIEQVRHSEMLAFNVDVTFVISQVFGAWPFLWCVPFHLYRSRPVGDGVRWRRHYLRAGDGDMV